MRETWQLSRDIRSAIGRRRFSRAVGRDENTVDYWCREPMSIRNPDGSGSHGLLDWIEALLETMATVPAARPTLLVIEHWFRATFDRLLRRIDGDPLDCSDERLLRASAVSVEHGEAMEKFLLAQDDTESLSAALNEALEARHEWDTIIGGIQRRLEHIDE